MCLEEIRNNTHLKLKFSFTKHTWFKSASESSTVCTVISTRVGWAGVTLCTHLHHILLLLVSHVLLKRNLFVIPLDLMNGLTLSNCSYSPMWAQDKQPKEAQWVPVHTPSTSRKEAWQDGQFLQHWQLLCAGAQAVTSYDIYNLTQYSHCSLPLLQPGLGTGHPLLWQLLPKCCWTQVGHNHCVSF